MQFPIVIHHDEGSSYGVTVPDLPGCFSGAETLEGVFGPGGVEEAIRLHLDVMKERGTEAPPMRPLEEHVANEDYAGGVWAVVDVDLADLAVDVAVRINISMPSRILNKIDREAREAGETRSGFLAKAALERIGAEP